MAELKIEKKVVNYVKKYFDNNSFEISSEDETSYLIYFNEDMCVAPKDISKEDGYIFGKNEYNLRIKIANRNLKKLKEILKGNKIIEPDFSNLLFMVLYIQAGINSFPDWLLLNDAHKFNISNLLKARLILNENLQDISISIKSPKYVSTFDNLSWSTPILKDIIKVIEDSLQLNDEIKDILNNPSISNAVLLHFSKTFDKISNPHPRDFLIIAAICTLIIYLNDKELLIRKNTNFSNSKQLKLISSMLQVNELLNFQELDDTTYHKNLGQKVRDFLKKLDYKLADFAPSPHLRF